jgi:hypothetical protein
MQEPPLLPEETLMRVQRVARFDGMAALILGAMFAISAASAREVPFTVIGLLAAGGGAMELHGLALIDRGNARGVDWLVWSQPLLLTVIFGYCALRLWLMDLPPIPEGFQDVFKASAEQWGVSVEEYQRILNRITVGAVAVIGAGFQGSMLVYYLRRRRAVIAALRDDDGA